MLTEINLVSMMKLYLPVLLLVVHSTYGNLASESTVASGKLISSPSPSSPPIPMSLGSLYRSTRDDYSARGRCTNCGPGYERDMRTYGRPTGITGYYSGMGSIFDDRNWYYRPESYEDRYRGGGEPAMSPYYQPQQGYGSQSYRQPPYMNGMEYDRYMQRPDDRSYNGYSGMAMKTGYYEGSSRMSYYPEMMRGYGYRGNGYDNLDPNYNHYMTQRGGVGMNNRDYYNGHYDDRMSNRGYYDQKNFRPWDETYSRPTTSSSSSSSTSSLSSASPSSSYTAHTSIHGPTAPGAIHTGYGPSSSSHGTHGYRPEHTVHQSNPDRPDYNSADSSPNCCRNRYPEQVPSQSGSYSSHGGHGSSGLPTYGQRPSSSGGSWSYVSSGGPISTGSQHYGGSNSPSAHGSYQSSTGGGSAYNEHHTGSAGSTGGSSSNAYGNRGSDHSRDNDHRQQR
ncbi:hornerin isoform X1 [Anopheles aquasalis]|uniref:hornerin isoform X1 n=1 Tax=Anopheles aquasalis TaxID=42839 RepID=UPI00215A4683|nr:hornerin isoform X1 [Anopheles aquasalis]